MKTKLLLADLLVFAALAFAAKPSTEKKMYTAVHVNPHAPVIDGLLNDAVWHKAEWAEGFTQRDPDDGASPFQPTSFKIVYDEDNLYVGVRAHDHEPEKIVRRVSRRDSFEGDWVEINIDSYFDHRTAFSFTLNAAGVKGDEAISLDGDRWDVNWNPVWFAGVAIDSAGWTAEMRLPFSQLRFAQKDEHVWGIQVSRRIFRKDERSVWQYIPQNTPGWVSFFGELHGLKGICSQRRIELLPYSVGSVRRFEQDEANPFATGQTNRLSGGLDAKMGVAGSFTLDLTLNPDFGQVEADPSQVNLTAFETFFEEKRPFFIEGQSILNYRLMQGDGSFSNDQLFYSRRIGRVPHHEVELDDGEYMDSPQNTSIAGALKLTGRTPGGLSIGLLDAVTDRETAEIDALAVRRQEAVEPRTNYFVGRVQQDFNKGTSAIGGMLTATHRNLADDHLQFLNHSAYTGGLDFRHQWHNRTYYLEAVTALSEIRGSQEALVEAQTSSRRYYQRPDADYLTLDSSRTSLSGHGGMLAVGRGGNSPWRANFGAMWRSPGLELNDVGFMRQADRIMEYAWVGYRVTNPFSIFRRLNVNFNQWETWNFGGESISLGGNVNGGGQLKNYWFMWFGVGPERQSLQTAALRGGPAMLFPGRWNQWFDLSTDERKSLTFGIGGFNSWADEGDSRSNELSVSMNYRPHNAMSIRISPSYSINKDNLQYVDTQSMGEDDRYLFGRLNQKTLAITMRLDYSVTPNLSIQFYGQPFVSAGQYSLFKRITSSRSENYVERFQTFSDGQISLDSEENVFQVDEDANGTVDYSFDRPDFNFREFRSNLVVRWEYSPGSTLFVVWSQGRSESTSEGRFQARSELRELFEVYPDNVFLVKLNRWFTL